MKAIKNILWISFEDTSPRFGCYGDTVARTPNVDALATNGRLYMQATTTASVCSPSRAAIITGMYAPAIGCQHMRTSRVYAAFPELPTPDEAVTPSYVKAFPEYLRAAGYFCTNNGKSDYQFGQPSSVWDLQGACIGDIESAEGEAHLNQVHWRQRPNKDQPFFAVFNLGWTHESGQWLENKGRVPAVTDPASVSVPSCLPDTAVTRQAIAQQYDHIAHNDRIVGHLLQQLEEDGLADETAIFIWSDHGEGLPRRKSWAYFTGSHVPLIIHAPGLESAVISQVTSLIDLAPTVLSMLQLPVPAHLHGRDLLAADRLAANEEDAVVFAHRDRIGESYDRIRSAFSNRLSYVRNYFPHHGRNPYQGYRHRHPVFQELFRCERAGTLNETQSWLFANNRPAEELYDRDLDPDEVVNLARDPAYAAELSELRMAVDEWEEQLGENARIDEYDMVRRWYPDGVPPSTAAPVLIPINAEHAGVDHSEETALQFSHPVRCIIQSATQGASIEVAINDGPWLLQQNAWCPEPGHYRLRARAVRYGYQPSSEQQWDVLIQVS